MSFVRWGGVAAIAGGLGWALFHLWYIQSRLSLPDDVERLYGLPASGVGAATALLAVGALSLFFQMRQPGKGFMSGSMLIAVGLALIALAMLFLGVFRIGASWLLGIAGEIAVLVGLVWLGVSSLARKETAVVGVLSLMMFPVYAYSVFVVEPAAPYAAEWASLVYGLLWVLLGYFIWRQSRVASI